MQGISPVKGIAEKNPQNVYAQMVLGLGGMKSGQYDKAIERFNLIVKTDPANMEAMFHLAECYELKGDKTNAVKWYEVIKSGVQDVNLKKAIAERIKQLKAS
jgi:lipopolysaccharide biosynthesis regulator YciM